MGSFGVIYSQTSLFLSFKVIKAKKAALVAENAKLHSKLFLSANKLYSFALQVRLQLRRRRRRTEDSFQNSL